jgi:hypothetical protein
VLLIIQRLALSWTVDAERHKDDNSPLRNLGDVIPNAGVDNLVNVEGPQAPHRPYHAEGKEFDVTGQPSWIECVSEPRWFTPQFVQLKIKAKTPCDWPSCYLQYVSWDDGNQDYDGEYLRERTVKPIVRIVHDEVTLDWHLLRPAVRLRMLLPNGARFTISEFKLYRGLPRERNSSLLRCFHLVLACINLGFFVTWISQHVSSLGRTLSRPAALSCFVVGLHGVLMVWLLPPFQGPDENRHWKAALVMFRSDAGPGSVLHELPNLLGAESPRWHGEVPFPAKTLRGSASRAVSPGEQSRVGYAGPWAYPFVALVSLFFPGVQSLEEALIFYYACRLGPLAVLLFLVATLWRQRLGSWTLVTFLSLPLVLQQCIVVSTDTVPNLGTLAAFLFFALPRRSWTLLLLTFTCVLVVLAKPPIYAVLLVLPAWYLPWSRLLRWQVVLPLVLAAAAVVVGGYFALWSVLKNTDAGLATDAQKQLQSLLTPAGAANFGLGLLEYPTRFLNPEYWWAPLGWLDTPMSDLHKHLLWACMIMAIAADLVRVGRRILGWWRELLEGLGFAVLHGVFVWVSLGAIMYLTISPLGSGQIFGMQVRYMIPVVLFGLLMPVALVRRNEPAMSPSPPNSWWVLVHGVLLTLAVVRAIQLAGDLQYRYWG